MAITSVGGTTGTGATTNSTTNSSSASSASSASTLGYDAFLKLLTAQMKYQDPTKPMDSTQFVSQLASFSAVEQQTKTNNKLDGLMTALALSQADGLIGRTVTSSDGAVTGVVKSINITSGSAIAVFEDGKTLTLDAGIKVS